MAKVTLVIDGDEVTYRSKKRMLKEVGRMILAGSDDPMTLRQLYYRFVALDVLENKESQYNYLGEAIKEARIDGEIPWGWVEDRTRSAGAGDHDEVEPRDHFEERLSWLKNADGSYNRPRWEGQDRYVEVWVEKEALAGVFEAVARDLKVVSFPNRGYTSVTLLKQAADRIEDNASGGSTPRILYFGDFDPSGQDIERNIRDKLNDVFGVSVIVERVALTREQIDERKLPPQPAKRSDSRYEDFVQEHGDMAVELDALPPEDLRSMVRRAVEKHFDEDQRQEVLAKQRRHRAAIADWIDEVLADD